MGYNFGSPKEVAKIVKGLSEIWLDKLYLGDRLIIDVQTHPLCIKIDFGCRGEKMAGFQLIEQPNCCGVLISTKTYVNSAYQKKGMAQAMMPLKEAIAKEFGYSCLSATVNVSGNPAEVHILRKCGWIRGESFVNSRTGNTVAFFTKVL